MKIYIYWLITLTTLLLLVLDLSLKIFPYGVNEIILYNSRFDNLFLKELSQTFLLQYIIDIILCLSFITRTFSTVAWIRSLFIKQKNIFAHVQDILIITILLSFLLKILLPKN